MATHHREQPFIRDLLTAHVSHHSTVAPIASNLLELGHDGRGLGHAAQELAWMRSSSVFNHHINDAIAIPLVFFWMSMQPKRPITRVCLTEGCFFINAFISF